MMATKAHCAYCFESLAASLERRQPLSLSQVETLWKKYNEGLEDGEEDDDDDDDDDDAMDDPPSDSHRSTAINRLLVPSPATASSSSVPSINSLSSAPSEVSSKSSSRSSFFSLGRKSKAEEKLAPWKIEESPLFVTWNTVHGSSTRLRGCIGTFEARELGDGLRSYALTSAFHDTRFDEKIALNELPVLECGVTLLSNFETASDPMAWEVGVHGLRISFEDNNNRKRVYGSTYLPDVANEQGWTKEKTLISLMQKAGWTGNKNEWRSVQNLKVVRYQGRQIKLRYPEWKLWREWVEQNGY